VLGHGPHSLHMRTRAEPKQAGPSSGSGGARPRHANTNATPFKGFLNLLHFESCFDLLSCGLVLIVLSLRVLELDCYVLER